MWLSSFRNTCIHIVIIIYIIFIVRTELIDVTFEFTLMVSFLILPFLVFLDFIFALSLLCCFNIIFLLSSVSSEKIHLEQFEVGKPEQLWTFSGGRIINTTRPTKVIAIKHSKNEDGAKLMTTKCSDEANQQWILDFVDDEGSH